jgi:hypothetical protein
MKINSTLFILIFLWSGISGFSQNIIYQEDFSDNTGLPDGWSTEDLSGQNVDWVRCGNFNTCGINPNSTPIETFNATSVNNGFALLNSDAYTQLSDNHISALISNAIDCSDADNVFLQFQTSIGTSRFNPAEHAAVIITNEMGNILTLYPFQALGEDSKIQLAPLPADTPDQAFYVNYDISSIAANMENVQIVWQWEGKREFQWMIDDIILSDYNLARPENALWYESFAFGLNGWTSETISGPDSSWIWEPNGDVDRAASIRPNESAYIHSLSSADGAAVFNADLNNTLGIPPPPDWPIKYYVCELVSPVIDLSDYDVPFALQFTQLLRKSNVAPDAPQTPGGVGLINSFSYSLDGGSTWSPPYDTAPYFTPTTAVSFFLPKTFTSYFPIPIEAIGTDEFRIKFTWASEFYFWVIDDVALVERPQWDMSVSNTFFARQPNYTTPQSQLIDIPLLADVINDGQQTAEEVIEEAIVFKQGDDEIRYVDSLILGSIIVDSLVENQIFPQLLAAETVSDIGKYNGYYTVSHNTEDERSESDTIKWSFEVSENTFAKEPGFTRDVTSLDGLDYTYGNIFYVPKGEGWYASRVTFGVGAHDRLQGYQAEIVMYKWPEDTNEDGIANAEEIGDLIGVYEHVFSDDDNPNSDETAIITKPIFLIEDTVFLEDNMHYIVAVKYELQGSDTPIFWMLVNDTLDYLATNFATTEYGIPQYASALDVGNTGNFSTIGFGYHVVPLVRLHIQNSLTDIPEPPKRKEYLKVFPNPARPKSIVTIETPAFIKNGLLTITDMSGKNVFDKKLSNVQQKAITFEARNLPSGNYTVILDTEKYLGTASLIIQE